MCGVCGGVVVCRKCGVGKRCWHHLLKCRNLNLIETLHQKIITLLLKKIKPFLFVYLFLYIKEIQKKEHKQNTDYGNSVLSAPSAWAAASDPPGVSKVLRL